jgi:6-phospho-beta-glucosidase
MKLAIIGGAGVRVPLLTSGLVGRGLPIDRLALFDVDASRLSTITRLASARAPDVAITTHNDVAGCVREADFVVTSIRVGGLDARRRDETVPLSHGVVGQETVGPGGFAMAVRTIPVLAAYAQEIATHAPSAWVINFTNPVGIVTQAMRRAADLKIVGICDTPTELFAEIAHALGVPVEACAFDYIGLNHLGWVREVYHQGRPLLDAVWGDEALLRRIYSRPLFPPAYLASLRLLPTDYVYYYDFPERAVEHIRAAGTSRGEVVSRLTSRLFADLAYGDGDPVETYEAYLMERSASYMQIESGQAEPNPPSPWARLTGYDRIAFDVMHAIVHNSNAVIPLNVPNRGNIPELAADDVVEVPCAVGANGPRALHAGNLPPQVRDLVIRVKEYERQTIAAAGARTRGALVEALAHNPLVHSREMAATLVAELLL